jgi:hypothetical protein
MGGMNIKVSFLIVLFGLFGCSENMDSQSEFVDLITVFDFAQEDDAWEAGISDFPVDYVGGSDFEFNNTATPASLALEGNELSISADNPDGEIFYFFRRKIPGLNPGTSYKVDFEFLVYTHLLTQSDNTSAEELYLKMGAVNYKPELKQFTTQNSEDYMALDVDKGIANSESGADVLNMGSVKEFTSGTPEVISGNTFDYNIITEADSDGAIWIVIGIDSGVKSKLSFGLVALTVYYREQN